MIIGITGHTSGIGKGLFDFYNQRGYHTVLGFSRTNGFDLSTDDAINKVATVVASRCDVFFNNAYADMAQVKLMYKIHAVWEHMADKTHVVIGSRAADAMHRKPQYYAITKAAIDDAAQQLQISARYRLINVRPSWTRTPMGLMRRDENDIFIEVKPFVQFIDSLVANKNFRIANVSIDPNVA